VCLSTLTTPCEYRGKPAPSSEATASGEKQCGSTTAGAVVEESKSVEGTGSLQSWNETASSPK
jgi:hypothetical protein